LVVRTRSPRPAYQAIRARSGASSRPSTSTRRQRSNTLRTITLDGDMMYNTLHVVPSRVPH